jgi:3-phosphoshikimate 1-carboxyvinyltransferase
MLPGWASWGTAVSDPSLLRFLPAKGGLRGALQVPGDKSISHRALLLGAVNDGPVYVTGFLRAADTLATLQAVRSLGVKVEEKGDELTVNGRGWEGLAEPADVIDVANAGTLMRLLPGLVSSRDILCVLTGDASIRRRPMKRVLDPLARMGALVVGRQENSLPPIAIRGGDLRATYHELPVASAQVKSCLLLAGLRATGETAIAEPAASRDHTERMIRYAGGQVEREGEPQGPGVVRVWPVDALRMTRLPIPGDFSSAAFFLVAGLLVPESEITLPHVGLNPTRTGLLRVLARMGAGIEVEEEAPYGTEPVGTLTVRFGELSATEIEPAEVPSLIDELPLFLLAAAGAKGTSRLRGASELRAKESDRLAAVGSMLRSLGTPLFEYRDGMDVVGRPGGWEGGRVFSHADHRLAMMGAVAGAASRSGVTVDDVGCMAVSYPGFVDALTGLGGSVDGDDPVPSGTAPGEEGR